MKNTLFGILALALLVSAQARAEDSPPATSAKAEIAADKANIEADRAKLKADREKIRAHRHKRREERKEKRAALRKHRLQQMKSQAPAAATGDDATKTN